MKIFSAALFAAILFATSVSAAVTLDATGTMSYAASATSISNTGQTVGTGSDRALVVVVVMTNRSPTSESMVWDTGGSSQAMTMLQSKTIASGPGSRVEIWGLKNPVSGNKTLSFSFSGASTDIFVSSVSFNGVDQTTPFTGGAGYSGSGSSPSFSSLSASGQASVGVTADDTSALSAPSQTAIFTDSTHGSILDAAAAYNIGGISPTFSWTDGLPSSNVWTGSAIVLASSSPPPGPPQMVTVAAADSGGALPSFDLNIADPSVDGSIDCPSWNASTLIAAAAAGYTVSGGSFSDSATGITITQGCDDAALYLTAPAHPFASGFPTVSSVTAPTIDANTAILFIIGQSNAGQHGSGGYISGSRATYDYSGSAFYAARDPLHDPGDAAPDGGPWVVVADGLIGQTGINGHIIEKVVIMSRPIGGTVIANWISGGTQFSYLTAQLTSLSSLIGTSGPSVYVIWQQGEADAGIGATASPYETKFASLLSTIQSYTAAPVYVSKTTTCIGPRTSDPFDFQHTPTNLIGKLAGQRQIRLAQATVVNGTTVRAGPDTDAIPPRWRWDGCHLGGYGLIIEAQGWLTTLH